jgi:hypothetical protein
MDHGDLYGSRWADDGAPDARFIGIGPALGDPHLVRALLVARVAVLVAAGRSTADIVRMLADSGVLAGSNVQPERLTDLVRVLQRHFAFGGTGDSVWLLGCALSTWSPESTYRLLLELWSAQRLERIPPRQVKPEWSEV